MKKKFYLSIGYFPTVFVARRIALRFSNGKSRGISHPKANQYPPACATIDLGITTYGIYLRGLSNILGYLDLNEILDQIAICNCLNFKRIHIFSLDNMTLVIDR
ncbi:MAG: hypothetical protein ACFE9Q_11925 [Candidatus Hodarchaeota archaeon]